MAEIDAKGTSTPPRVGHTDKSVKSDEQLFPLNSCLFVKLGKIAQYFWSLLDSSG